MDKTTEQRLQEAREAVLVAISKLRGVTEQPLAGSYWMTQTLHQLNLMADRIGVTARNTDYWRATPEREGQGE